MTHSELVKERVLRPSAFLVLKTVLVRLLVEEVELPRGGRI